MKSVQICLTALLGALFFASTGIAQERVPRDRCDIMEDRAEQTLRTMVRQVPEEEVDQALHPRSTFVENAVVRCYRSVTVNLPRVIRTTQTELGEAQGFPYSIQYSVASASVFEPGADVQDVLATRLWDVTCELDPMTDDASCRVSHRQGDLWMYWTQAQGWRVRVGTNHYPDGSGEIRFDEDSSLTSREGAFSAAESATMVERLKAEPRVRTRYARWPTGFPTSDFSSLGFPLVLELSEWLVEELTVP